MKLLHAFRGFLLTFMAFVVVVLGGCKIEEEIAFRADGSGRYRARISVQMELAEALDGAKEELAKEGLLLVEEGEENDRRFQVFEKQFASIEEVAGSGNPGSFVARRRGLLSREYELRLTVHDNMRASGFERHMTILFPAPVKSTSSGRVAGKAVEWDASSGGGLTVIAEGLAWPANVGLWWAGAALLLLLVSLVRGRVSSSKRMSNHSAAAPRSGGV